ncbi:MAG: glutathione S-transferase family protein, partial [Pseudomonadota bacterium]
MCNLPYTTVNVLNPAKGPKGKLPYITDGSNTVTDSGLILDYLKATYGDQLDAGLDLRTRAEAHALRRLLEEHLYWCAVYDRWAVNENWALTKPAFFGALPPAVRDLVAALARRGQLRALRGHGVGRHTSGEIYALGCADLTALSDFLADKPFFLGAEPTALDATAYAFLVNLLWVPIDSPLTRHVRSFENFIAYVKRMKQRYYD